MAGSRLRALKSMRYGTRMLQAGEEFDAKSARDVKILTALKRAERAAPQGAVQEPVTRNRMLRAEEPETPSDRAGVGRLRRSRSEEAAPEMELETRPASARAQAEEDDDQDADENGGPTRTELRRMTKAELIVYLQNLGQHADEEATRDELLNRALDQA